MGVKDLHDPSSGDAPLPSRRVSPNRRRRRWTDRCAGGRDLGLHHAQHPAHIRMIEDRRIGLARPDRTALATLQRIGEGVLVCPFRNADALHPDRQTRGVHHDEHMGQALVRLADQLGARALIAHDAGGRGVDAQLVLDADGTEGVALAQASVILERELGRQKQADPFRPLRGVGQAGQNQMDDVVRRIVSPPGDENLLAVQRIGPVAVRRRGGGQGAQVRTSPRPRSGPWPRSIRR